MRTREKINRSNLTPITQALITFTIIGALLFVVRIGYNKYGVQGAGQTTLNQAQEIGLAQPTQHIANFAQQFPLADTVINYYLWILGILWFVCLVFWIAKSFLIFSE